MMKEQGTEPNALLTVEDIQRVQFSKSFGGYRTDEVDEFLDRCAETVDVLTSAHAADEQKMQVLAESIVDYREREDSIRTALLDARRMSDTILEEARQRAEQILAEAGEEAAHVRETAQATIEAEKAEMARVRNEVAAFKARLMSIYREHLTLIGVLEDAPAEATSSTEPEKAEKPEPAEQTEETEKVAQNASAPAAEETAAHTEVEAETLFSSETEPETVAAPRFDLSRFSLEDE